MDPLPLKTHSSGGISVPTTMVRARVVLPETPAAIGRAWGIPAAVAGLRCCNTRTIRRTCAAITRGNLTDSCTEKLETRLLSKPVYTPLIMLA